MVRHRVERLVATNNVGADTEAPRPDVRCLRPVGAASMFLDGSTAGVSPPMTLPTHLCSWARSRARCSGQAPPCTECGRPSPFQEMSLFMDRFTTTTGAWAPPWAPAWWVPASHARDPAFAEVATLMARLSALHDAWEELQCAAPALVPETCRRALGMAMSLHMPLVMAVEDRGSDESLCTGAVLGGDTLLLAYPSWRNPNMPPHFGSSPDLAADLPTLFSEPPSSDAWIANVLPKARPARLAPRAIMTRLGNELWAHPEDSGQNFHLHIITHLLFPSLTGDLPGAQHVAGLAPRLLYARLLRPTPHRPHLYGRLLAWISQHVAGLHTNQAVVFINQERLVCGMVDVLAAQVDALPVVRYAMGQLFDWAAWCALRRGTADEARRWLNTVLVPGRRASSAPPLTLAHSNLAVHLALYATNHTSPLARAILANTPYVPSAYTQLGEYVQQRMSGRKHSRGRFKQVDTEITGVVRLHASLARCKDLRDFRRAIFGMRALGLQVRQFLPNIVYAVSGDAEDVRVLQAVEAEPRMDPVRVLALANSMSNLGVSMLKLLTPPRADRIQVVIMDEAWGVHQRAAIRARYGIPADKALPAVYTTWSACPGCGRMGRSVVTFDSVFASVLAMFPGLAVEWQTAYRVDRDPNGCSANGMPHILAAAPLTGAPRSKRRRVRRASLLEYTTRTGVSTTPLNAPVPADRALPRPQCAAVPAQSVDEWRRATADGAQSALAGAGAGAGAGLFPHLPFVRPDDAASVATGTTATALHGRVTPRTGARSRARSDSFQDDDDDEAGGGVQAVVGADIDDDVHVDAGIASEFRNGLAAAAQGPPTKRARGAGGRGRGVPPKGGMDVQDLLEALEEGMGLLGEDEGCGGEDEGSARVPTDGTSPAAARSGNGWGESQVRSHHAPKKAAAKKGHKRQRLDVLANEGSNDVCVRLCDECGNLDWFRTTCTACSGRGVVLVCNRKYHGGGATHSKRHCEMELATFVALGTKVVLNGSIYMLCPRPGCGLPARYDPSSATHGSDMCALCHFKDFCFVRDLTRGANVLTPLSVRSHGHMACIRCGTMAQPWSRSGASSTHGAGAGAGAGAGPTRARRRPPAPGRGYMYNLAHGTTRRVGWFLVCWRCWHVCADRHCAGTGLPVYVQELVALLNMWNARKFKRSKAHAHMRGQSLTGRAVRDTDLTLVDIDGITGASGGNSNTAPANAWQASVEEAARLSTTRGTHRRKGARAARPASRARAPMTASGAYAHVAIAARNISESRRVELHTNARYIAEMEQSML